jgi:predicted glycosyltransferase
MKVLFDVGHPAHAHFFKFIITNLIKKGYEIKIAARKREMLFYLLDKFGLDYTVIGHTREGLLSKAADMLRKDMALLKVVEQFQPDLMLATGSGSPYSAQVGKLKNIPNITCTDTEHARFINWLTLPFTDIVCTPSCYTKPIRAKYHVSYDGYHELAYLHPDHFKPSSNVFEIMNIPRDDKIILIKFAQWTASHDLGVNGFNFKNQEELISFVEHLGEFGRVFISSEVPLPAKLKGYRIKLPYELIHELIARSTLYLGEGATMASEAAVLGVPSIFISNLRLGYLDELSEKYGLVYSYSDRTEALSRAEELLTTPGTRSVWSKRRKQMLKDKIDVSNFITELILDFPNSIERYKVD